MKFNIFKLVLSTSLLIAVYLIVKFSPPAIASYGYEKYLNFSCTGLCIACNANTSNVAPQMTELCSKRTYDDIDACRKICMEKRMAVIDTKGLPGGVVEMMNDCEDCLGSSKCQGIEPDLCKAINNERDMVEVFMNASAKKIGDQKVLTINCPERSKLDSEDKKCICDPGYEFDSLHTACLNKQATVDNIKTLLTFLPDEILDEIKKKAQEHISESLDKDASLLSLSDKAKENLKLLGGMVSSQLISDGALAELIYTNVIYNTDNLRQLIKYLGKSKTEKLIEILETLTSQAKTESTAVEEVGEEVKDNMSLDEYYQFNSKVYNNVRQLCKSEKDACQKRCVCGDLHWYSYECPPNFPGYVACETDCRITAGCGTCRNDADCDKFGRLGGYQARCGIPDGEKEGLCALVKPIKQY